MSKDLPSGEAMLAALRALTPTCSRCANPAPIYESVEIAPLCTSCVIRLSFENLIRELE